MPHLKVRDAPPKPLLIFDGDCHFCRRWIERWRCLTAGSVEYASFQEVAERFPEIPREAFEKSVQFIETDGTVFGGAEAVLRSLGRKHNRNWMMWAYQHVPVSPPSLKQPINLWPGIGGPLHSSLACSGAPMSGRRPTFSRVAGSSARSAAFI